MCRCVFIFFSWVYVKLTLSSIWISTMATIANPLRSADVLLEAFNFARLRFSTFQWYIFSSTPYNNKKMHCQWVDHWGFIMPLQSDMKIKKFMELVVYRKSKIKQVIYILTTAFCTLDIIFYEFIIFIHLPDKRNFWILALLLWILGSISNSG